jgi:hypothetical protein
MWRRIPQAWGVSQLALGLACCAVLLAVIPEDANALGVRQTLVATGADADASGKASLKVKKRKGQLSGQLVVLGKKLDADATYEIAVDGVRLGTLETNRRGKGKARFRTSPRAGKDQLLGVDPRGRTITIVVGGVPVLTGALSDDSLDDGDVRCCVPDDSGTECEDRTPAECDAEGGVNLGAGSCLPNPCEGTTPGDEVVCCLPDDSGPECEDRTPAQCAAEGGVSLGAGACVPEPCTTMPPPDGDVRCCLADDSGTECEDRTAGECALLGGLNLGPGTCLPNPCFPGGTTSTTIPASVLARVTCEKRSDRSRVSVDGQNLAAGSYRARVTSGANVATSDLAPTIGDEVEIDFDSDPGDIAAGATAIAADFIVGTPAAVTGELLGAGDAVVASATATCVVR